MLEIKGIAEIGLPDGISFVVRTFRSRCAIPGGQRMLRVVWHQPNRETLTMTRCVCERPIDDLPMDFALFRFERFPEPTAVRDRTVRKIRTFRVCCYLMRWPFFGPVHSRVQGVAIEALKSLTSHSGVSKYFIDALRIYDNGLSE